MRSRRSPVGQLIVWAVITKLFARKEKSMRAGLLRT